MTEQAEACIASVVVCEDDDVTLELLCDHLVADRFSVLPAPSASDALRLCRYNHPDLLLLDLSLPDASGLDVMREIRAPDRVDSRLDPRLPVIMLGAEALRIRGLDSGADDYLVKPFSYPELRARIGAVLRRCSGPQEESLQIGDLRLDQVPRRVIVGERQVSLARKEFSLLCALAADPTRVFSKQELLLDVWGVRDPGRVRTLESCADRLRGKLDPEHGRFVVNCWGVGYRLVDG
jgi:DNA-binding response OmpR family regulator